jgi:hypothetical protein
MKKILEHTNTKISTTMHEIPVFDFLIIYVGYIWVYVGILCV